MNYDVILASDNLKKFAEFSVMLKGVCTLKSQSQRTLNTPPETGATFEENAVMKAQYVCASAGLPALADDSGLAVDALSGAPGIFSSRYAGEDADDAANLAKLIQVTAEIPLADLTASFHCAIAYLEPAMEQPVLAYAVWHGRLVRQPVGDNGFGYDPIFYVPQYNCTAAQLPMKVKNKVSHRALALRQLKMILTHDFQ